MSKFIITENPNPKSPGFFEIRNQNGVYFGGFYTQLEAEEYVASLSEGEANLHYGDLQPYNPENAPYEAAWDMIFILTQDLEKGSEGRVFLNRVLHRLDGFIDDGLQPAYFLE